jgi:cadmium resistance protein CadD (predicted permease)
MARLVDVGAAAVGAFAGTNVDDFVVLLLLILGIPEGGLHRRQIVAGQYLGFGALVTVSLLGAAALRPVPESSIGLFGLVPLGLGVRGVIKARKADARRPGRPILAGNMTAVAIVTIANGVDNVFIYILFFRELGAMNTAISIVVFLVMLGMLCTITLAIGERARAILSTMRNTQWLSPAVLIVIGVAVLIRTGALAHLAGLAS